MIYKKPRNAQLDFSNGLTKGLQIDLLINEAGGPVLRDTVTRKTVALNSMTWANRFGDVGIDVDATGEYARIADLTPMQVRQAHGRMTIELEFTRDGPGSGTSYGGLAGYASGTAFGDRRWAIENDNGDVGWGLAFQYWFSSQLGIWSIPYPAANKKHHLIIIYDSSGTTPNPSMYLNGVKQTVTERVTPSGTPRAGGTYLALGNLPEVGGAWNGNIYRYRQWSRLLTDNEARSLAQDPFQIYQSSLVYPKAAVVTTQTVTTTAKARVKVLQAATVTAKARVKALQAKTVTAKARTKISGNTVTVTSKARVKSLAAATVTAKARVKQLNTTVTSTAKARVKKLGANEYFSEPATDAPLNGTLTGNASFDEADDYIVLTPATNGQNGQFELTENVAPTAGFEVTFDWWTGGGDGADAVWFFFGNSVLPTGEDDSTGCGYAFAIDEYNSNTIQLRYAGTGLLDNLSVSDIDNSTWRTAKVRVLKLAVGYNVSLAIDDGTYYIEYNDATERTLPGTRWGFASRTGGLNNEHRIRNIVVSYLSTEISTKARVKVVQTKTATAKARIATIGNVVTVTSKARVKQLATTQTVTAKASIITTTVQTVTVTAKARIKVLQAATVTAKARVKSLGTTQTITAKARVKHLATTQTATAKARVLRPYSATIQAKARIKVLQAATTTAKARIKVGQTQTVTARARVAGIGIATSVTAKTRIKKVDQQSTATAKARVKVVNNNKTVTAKARVQEIQTQSVTSRARIKFADQEAAIQPKARVKFVAQAYEVTAKARVEKIQSSTVQSKARVKKIATQTIQARARIEIVQSASATAKARIATAGTTATVSARARIRHLDIEQTLTARTRVKKINNSNTVSVLARKKIVGIGYRLLVDQQQLTTNVTAGFGEFNGVRYRGQGFIPSAGKDLLGAIAFRRAKGSQGIKIYIDTADSNSLPTNSVGSELYSFTVTNAQITGAYQTFQLPVPLQLTAGQRYCFYIAPWNTSTDAYANDYRDAYFSNNPNSYTSGKQITFSSGSWSNENLDWNFQTFYLENNNVTAKARIKDAQTQTITAKTRVKIVQSASAQVLSRVKNAGAQTVTAKARVGFFKPLNVDIDHGTYLQKPVFDVEVSSEGWIRINTVNGGKVLGLEVN